MKKWIVVAVIFAGFLGGITSDLLRQEASAHAGSPALTVWSNGQSLTASALNNSFAHIDNTFSGGITDSMLSTAAAIAHSKLATPALIPKAWAQMGSSVCTGAGTNCGINESSKVNWIHSTATNGVYDVDLSYVPANASFAVFTTPMVGDNVCSVTGLASGAVGTKDFTVTCLTGGAVPGGGIPFMLVVFDT